MSDLNNHTRKNKFEKRRKNTKSISLLLILGGILIIILFCIFLFGGNNEEAGKGQPSTKSTSEDNSNSSNDEAEKDETNDNASDDNNESSNDDSTNSDDASDSESDDQSTTDEGINNDDVKQESVEVSDDANVKEAYTADWKPIGTEQEGPHAKKFSEGTQDRIEMEKALRVATGIQEDDMITWWLANGGGQDVIGTVSNKAEEKTYRVYLTWVENEGWQPTKVEILKENDKK